MEKHEIEVIKTMKEKYNIEIPEDSWLIPMNKAEDYVEHVEGFKEFGLSGNFDNIFIVIDTHNNWGFVDLEHGVYLEPACYDLALKDNHVIMNNILLKHEDGSDSFFHYNYYNVEDGKFSVDFKTTKELSKQGRQLDKELFPEDNLYGGIAEQAHGSGFQTISIDEKMGLLSEDTLTRYIEPQYDVLMLAWGDVEELCNQITKKDQIYCVVKNNGKFGVVDLSNKVILPLDFGSFDELESYCKEQIAQVGV